MTGTQFENETLDWNDAGTDLEFSPEGKHEPVFQEDFPLLLHLYSFPHGLRLTPSYHDYLELAFMYRGTGVFHVENKDYPVEPGDLFVLDNTVFHSLESKDPAQLKVVTVYFWPELVYRPGGQALDFEYLRPFFDKRIAGSHRIPAHDHQNEPIVELLWQIYLELRDENEFHQLAVKNRLCEILLRLRRHYEKQETTAKNHKENRVDFERLRKIFQFLQNHYHEKLRLQQVAQLAAMSPHYFCKFFKRNTGQTLTEFLLRMRVDKAKELLLQTQKTVTEIAFEVGFENHSYFDRVFKRLTQCSPMAFRKENRAAAETPRAEVGNRKSPRRPR